MTTQLVTDERQCILVGTFQPMSFSPLIFVEKGPFRPGELRQAKINIIHPDVCNFIVSEITFTVERQKLTVSTSAADKFGALRDAVIAALVENDSTPIEKAGINLNQTFKVEKDDEWHKIGDSLVPKDSWNKILEPTEASKGRKSPGMRTVVVEGKNLNGEGYVRVKVEPVENNENEKIFSVAINNHFVFPGSTDSVSVLALMRTKWEKAFEDSKKVMDKISSLGQI